MRRIPLFPIVCLLLISISPLHAKWMELFNTKGDALVARVVKVEDGVVTLVRKKDGKEFALKLASLSKDSQELVKSWKDVSGVAEEEDLNLPKSLYPNQKHEILEQIERITATKPSAGISEEQQRVINELNIYRFLCGVPYDVKGDPKMVAGAKDAAIACEKNGSLSHRIGHSTDKCNLAGGGGMFDSVRGFIEDPGAKNRVHRGHRRWCLNAAMKKTGFGESESGYAAMWVWDESGKKSRKPWSYPGAGLFPHERLQGNAWSLYLTKSAPAKEKLTVEVYKLLSRPEKAFSSNAEIEGEKLPVPWVSTELNSINFEPEADTVGKGIYWVRVSGGGVREGYLVELY